MSSSVTQNILDIRNRADFRAWLEANHAKEPEVWVHCKRGRPIDNTHLWYLDAIEEALCFGWIDAVTKKLDDGITYQRWCPRRKNSNWTELNKARAKRLIELGLMTDAGKATLPDLNQPFIIDPEILTALKADKTAWENFQAFPELYRHVRVDTIQIKKKNPELFRKRLQKLVDNSHNNTLYGQWNDYGRLA